MSSSAPRFAPDVLAGFEAADVDGPTLVRPVGQGPAPVTVLHVHGWNDYFFQDHLAEAVRGEGHAFYAVDLRRAGRSRRPGDLPHFMRDASEQGHDIARAVRAILDIDPATRIVVHAHSTGGLTAAVSLAGDPQEGVAGLILNSPLFGVRRTTLQAAGMLILPTLAALAPRMVVVRGPSRYSARMHREGGGRWVFDTTWKDPAGVPVRAAWAAAVDRAQKRIARGLEMPIPVLVARSASSGSDADSNPHRNAQDTVVDVDAIATLSEGLRGDISHLVIEGAVHDLSLSADGPRSEYLERMLAWIATVTT